MKKNDPPKKIGEDSLRSTVLAAYRSAKRKKDTKAIKALAERMLRDFPKEFMDALRKRVVK